MKIAAFARDRKGAVAIEFALLTALFFSIILVALDFGAFFIERSRTNEAISAASIAAFSNRDSLSYTAMPELVRQYGGFSDEAGLSVDIRCNGTSTCTNGSARQCACLGTSGNYVANSCGSPCSGTGMTSGSTAGYYLTIKARRTFNPLVLPRGLVPTAIDEQATVRLQ